MERASFRDMTCSIARTLDVIGDTWTPLILRDIGLGITRFETMQRNLGISRKVLARRLAALVEHGVVQRVRYQDNPTRYDYLPTEKGVELLYILLAMKTWGDRWVFGEGEHPMLFRHACGATTDPVMTCPECGDVIRPGEVTPVAGPGLSPGPGTSEIPAALDRWQVA